MAGSISPERSHSSCASWSGWVTGAQRVAIDTTGCNSARAGAGGAPDPDARGGLFSRDFSLRFYVLRAFFFLTRLTLAAGRAARARAGRVSSACEANERLKGSGNLVGNDAMH